jgi:hypothetical protein
MKATKISIFLIIILTSILLTANILSAQTSPVLFFSDLTWGPKTGWEGSATKGAAVSVWGKNFGSSRGTNHVTVGGVNLSNDTDYAEWGVTGTANHIARGLERITFWLNSNMSSGITTISVTVGGLTSNSIPFTISTGTIYFISVSDGNNSYNGLYSMRSGHSGNDGPFKDILKFNPGNNPSGDGQYIIYVRGGTYTVLDVDNAFIAFRGPYGGPSAQKALIAYPGEVPLMDTGNASRGIIWVANYSPYGHVDYVTISKIYNTGGTAPYNTYGSHVRYVGNHIRDCLDETWNGLIWVGGSQYVYIYGNYFDHNGYDSYKHNIYIKSEPQFPAIDYPSRYVYVGWNEFNNPVASDTHGGAIFLSTHADAPAYTQNIYIHDNYFHDGTQSDFIYSDDSQRVDYVWIWNNIFTGGQKGAGTESALFLTFGDLRHFYIYNNTFYSCASTDGTSNGVVAVVNDTKKQDIRFANNIFVANANSTQGFIYLDSSTSGISTISSRNDLYYSPTGVSPPNLGGGRTNSVIDNPMFTNAAARDFTLQSSSPAIGKGTSSLTGDADSDIPVATRDYNGVSRGSVYDIGACEYEEGGGNNPPSAPTNLRIVSP